MERWNKTGSKPIWSSLYKVYCAWCNECENGYKLKRNALKRALKAIAGKADMPDDEFFMNRNNGMIVSRWCLNEYALSYYQAYL